MILDFSSFGNEIMGDEIMGDSTSEDLEATYATYTGRRRGEFGFGYFGQRMYGRTYPFTPFTRGISTGGGFAFITFTSSSGAILGRIRTDIQRTIVHSLEFTVDEKGCADFTLTLNDLPPFPLLPMSQISVNAFNTEYEWFAGTIESAPEEGVRYDQYVYRGFGTRKELARLKAEETYVAPLDVGVIVDDIVLNYINGRATIGYNESKIDTATGVLIASTNELSTADLEKVFSMYATMCAGRWGVDGDNELYFELKTDTVLRTFWAGISAGQFEIELQTDGVYNSIFVKRQEGRGSGGSGWAVAAIANDETSQAKYGLRELQYQMAGYFEDSDCELVAERLLEEKKDPKHYCKMQNLPIRSAEDYLRPGRYRFVSELSQFASSLNECDDATEWTITQDPGQDLSITEDSDILVSAAGSLRLQWTEAYGAFMTAPVTASGALKKVRVYVRGLQQGTFINIGIGNGSWTQHKASVPINTTSTWLPFEWDISSLGLTVINEIGVEVIDQTSGALRRIWIDRIEIEIVGSKHYIMDLTRATYRFTPSEQVVTAEFGPPPKRMYDYVSALQAQAEESKYVGEIR